MKFDDLINMQPNVRVCDIIQLFLLGQDDKIYLNLQAYNKFEGREYYRYILKSERIISDKWDHYYENKIKWIEEADPDDYDLGYLTLVI